MLLPFRLFSSYCRIKLHLQTSMSTDAICRSVCHHSNQERHLQNDQHKNGGSNSLWWFCVQVFVFKVKCFLCCSWHFWVFPFFSGLLFRLNQPHCSSVVLGLIVLSGCFANLHLTVADLSSSTNFSSERSNAERKHTNKQEFIIVLSLSW